MDQKAQRETKNVSQNILGMDFLSVLSFNPVKSRSWACIFIFCLFDKGKKSKNEIKRLKFLSNFVINYKFFPLTRLLPHRLLSGQWTMNDQKTHNKIFFSFSYFVNNNNNNLTATVSCFLLYFSNISWTMNFFCSVHNLKKNIYHYFIVY